MRLQVLQLSFFISLVLAVAVVSLLVFLPYLSPIFLAIVFAVVLKPFYEKTVTELGGHQSLAALLMVIVLLVVIVVPLLFFGSILLKEVTDLSTNLFQNGVAAGSVSSLLLSLENWIVKLAPQSGPVVHQFLNLEQGVSNILHWGASNLNLLFSKTFDVLIGIIIMFFGVFYLLRDGKKFAEALIKLSPLPDRQDRKIFTKMGIAIESVIREKIIIAILQGLLVGVGFYMFGLANPVLWGAVAAVASLVPNLGTALVVAPAVVLLVLKGSIGSALGLTVWGAVVVGLIDNLLGPYLIQQGVKIHPFIILIAVLGGVSLFGPIGFIAGPVLISLLFALLEMYPSMVITKPVRKTKTTT